MSRVVHSAKASTILCWLTLTDGCQVDVVPNHMAFDGNATNTDYSTFYPFNDRSLFHNVCFITEWTNVTQIQQCWLGGEVNPLPDLNTTSPKCVQNGTSGSDALSRTTPWMASG